jgi:cytochrome c-type biogenesis protein
MSDFSLAIGAAFWLGFLTAISPCLMATNVAAITFIARKVNNTRYALLSGLFYIGGQALAYVLMSMLIVTSLLSKPLVSLWLQDYMTRLLGPILIITALFLLELLTFHFGSGRLKQEAQQRAEKGGLWVASLLGIVFAMSFCPTTAALFFGSLIPLAITHESSVVLPLIYALGVAVPVLIFALLITLASHRVGQLFQRVQHAERWARFATGGIFLAIGFYFTLAYTLHTFGRRLLQGLVKVMVKGHANFHIEATVHKGQANLLPMLLRYRHAQATADALARLQNHFPFAQYPYVRLFGGVIFFLLRTIIRSPFTQAAGNTFPAVTVQTASRFNARINQCALNLRYRNRRLVFQQLA